MSHPLTENTKLKCNKGTKETPLKVTSHSGLKINSLLKATEKDKEANTNIIPFGQCKLKPTSGGYLPCTPAIKQWEKTSPFSLNGMKKLTTDSFCMCATGGKVSPLTPPETFINVIEKSIQEENNNQDSDSTNNDSDSDIVIFSDDISQDRRDIVSAFTIKILEDVAKELGIKTVKITSTIRSLDRQLEAMYNNISRGKIISYKAPGKAVTEVCQEGLKQKLPKSTIISNMKKKALEYEAKGQRISLHVVSNDAYSKLNVIDITKSVDKTKDFITKLAEKEAVTKIIQPISSTQFRNNKIVYSQGEDAIHVEIKQS